MSNDLKKRMNEMYLRDCFMAWFDVVLLWAAVIFVLIAILRYCKRREHSTCTLRI